MNTCPSCNSDLEESYKFCPSCSMQLKCSECNEKLLPGKSFCFACGGSIQQRQESSKAQLNEFLLEEKRTKTSASRIIKGNLSDNAFSQAVTLLGVLPPTQIVQSPKKVVNYEQGVLPSPDFNHEYLEQNIETIPSSNQAEPNVETVIQNSPEETKVLKYFKQHGDSEIVPKISDFKGKTKKDQQERFIVLHIWAFNKFFRDAAPNKQQLLEMSKKRQIYDRNLTSYFDPLARQFFMNIDGRYELNPEGEQEVDKILKEIDDGTAKGFPYWSGNSKSGVRTANLTKEELQQLNQWLETYIETGKLDIRSLKSATNYAMFAIWCITKYLKVAEVVKPKMAYSYLTKKYPAISVSSNSFSKALNRNIDKFGKNKDDLYFISENAEKQVEKWIKGDQVEHSAESIDENEKTEQV